MSTGNTGAQQGFQSTTPDFESCARICHEANRIYCLSIGDRSQPTWEGAPAWQKESALNGVKAIFDNPAMTPRESHESWKAEKVAAGWIYGEVKDPEKKIHPCIVPYESLPKADRLKDHLFGAVVRAFFNLPQLAL